MRNKVHLAATAALALAWTAQARAEEPPAGLWLRVTPQTVIVDTVDFAASGVTGNIAFGAGWGVGVALGYEVTPVFSVALEGGYLRAPFDSITINGFGTADVEGDADIATGYVNGYLRPLEGRFQPYFGAGVGLAHAELEVTEVSGIAVSAEESDTRFSFNATVGLEWMMADATSFGAHYRFYWIDTESGEDVTAHGVGAVVTAHF